MRLLLRQHLATLAFVLLALGNMLGWRTLQAEQDARARELVTAEAKRCVDRWDLHDQTQSAIEQGALISAEALIRVALEQPDPNEPALERFRAEVERDLAEASDELEDPECDRREARHLIGE